ncbi:hypothetical protein M440DRAFT_1462944 [Trichoderma longibrachiatum ATCC 18648]|uniref:Uncharacterized protein n=1 Tax=Trichoderma longibrachiatum ATCC 18648 TaxID=983965 RepID=A0A2T4C3J1_TRILO|nr:hypothetical protein M440DRAFT_1462944 [Trichoderma longibrachiatum ATCC 18648]
MPPVTISAFRCSRLGRSGFVEQCGASTRKKLERICNRHGAASNAQFSRVAVAIIATDTNMIVAAYEYDAGIIPIRPPEIPTIPGVSFSRRSGWIMSRLPGYWEAMAVKAETSETQDEEPGTRLALPWVIISGPIPNCDDSHVYTLCIGTHILTMQICAPNLRGPGLTLEVQQAEILILKPYKDSPDQAGLGSCTLRERGVLRKDKYSGFTR